jgi:Ferritin-like domain
MKEEVRPSLGTGATPDVAGVEDSVSAWRRVVKRRSFLRGFGAMGAAVPAVGLLATKAGAAPSKPTKGDVAILQFLLAVELIETDLWQQYNELGGVNGGNPAYIAALENLDGDMPQYIADNTDDEISHSTFLKAYLESIGVTPVSLDNFRSLRSSQATGARNIGRLTNLQALNVDLSWYTRYRGKGNPDLGATFTSPFNINNQPAIPLNDSDTPPNTAIPDPAETPGSNFTGAAARMQAIANTAGFHFAFIEQGGASLYTTMSLKATSLEVLRIIVSIGGVEVDHFAVWHDKAGNAVAEPLAGVMDPLSKLTFPDLNNSPFGGERFQTNLILPEPCQFLRTDLPECSVIRPSSTALGGAVATIKAFTDDLLFMHQSPAFLNLLMDLASAADAAERLG